MTSWEFFDYLLENANVVGTPGSGFGPSGEAVSYTHLDVYKRQSVYNMTVRENQMEKSLSLALSGAMNRYYEPNMYIVDKKPVSS